MKTHYAASLNTGDKVTDFFMVKSGEARVGSNGKAYLDFVLGDASGEINAKKWDVEPEDNEIIDKLQDCDIIKVEGSVAEWNGQRQLRIGRMRLLDESRDQIDIEDFVRTAPESGEEMFAYIMDRAEAIGDEDLRKLCVKELTERKEKLLYYPAAFRLHHAIRGGLLYHMKRMLMTGERICEVYPILQKDLVVTGVIIHDLEKIEEILSNEYGISPGYSFEGQMLGHLVQGVARLDKVCEDLGMPTEKKILLQHMVLTHHYEPEFGSPKKPLFPEAEILHYLDIIDARMYDMEDALANVPEGEFSDKVWSLDNRKLYKFKL